jgi:hypothetical protein
MHTHFFKKQNLNAFLSVLCWIQKYYTLICSITKCQNPTYILREAIANAVIAQQAVKAIKSYSI